MIIKDDEVDRGQRFLEQLDQLMADFKELEDMANQAKERLRRLEVER